MVGEFGLNQAEKDKAPHSASPCPEEISSSETPRQTRILLAEDNPGDVLMVREALAHHRIDAQLTCLRDGEQMIRYLDRIHAGEIACPDVILLDLNLPRQDGRSVLTHIRKNGICGDIPVIVVTSSSAAEDRDVMAQLGATRYFHKPIDYDESMRLGLVVLEVLQRK